MPISSNFRGCKVYIYNAVHGALLASTTVLTHDPTRVIITIGGNVSSIRENDKVSLLIIHNTGIYEYMGTVRKSDNKDKREIALYKGKTKEDRTSIRYTVNMPAKIESVTYQALAVPFIPPVEVLIINLSSAGMLIHSSSSALHEGSEFKINLCINQNVTLLNAKVTRVQETAPNEYTCGCLLISRE